MKRAALYLRVSTLDQHPESQLHDLRQLATQRGLAIVREYTDHGVSGARARRPALDQMLADARRGQFQILLVWACDRLARSTRHFLEVLDELSRLNIEFASFREQLDTGGPLGRAVVVIISAIAELERSLIVERVRAGMRRARLEGRRLGRRPLDVDREAVRRDRSHGLSLAQLAKVYGVSRTSVRRILSQSAVPQGSCTRCRNRLKIHGRNRPPELCRRLWVGGWRRNVRGIDAVELQYFARLYRKPLSLFHVIY